MPTNGPIGTTLAVVVAPRTDGMDTALSPARPMRCTAGSLGTAYAWSVVATASSSQWLVSRGCTTPGSVTATSTGVPSAGNPTTCSGDTALPIRLRWWSGPTS